jgi:hypothetical protein
MLDSVNPRDALPIAERDSAAEAETHAAHAVVRAKSIVDDNEKMLAMLAGVDEEIVAHRANDIRAAAAGCDRLSGELPPHLARKQELKIKAEQQCEAAKAAHSLLQRDLVAASGHLQHQQVAVQRAAGAVLSAEAPALISELAQARQTVWKLEAQLKALSAVRYFEADGRSVTIKMPPDTFAALNETAPPMLAMSVPKPYAIALDRWNGFLQALTENSEASLDGMCVERGVRRAAVDRRAATQRVPRQ